MFLPSSLFILFHIFIKQNINAVRNVVSTAIPLSFGSLLEYGEVRVSICTKINFILLLLTNSILLLFDIVCFLILLIVGGAYIFCCLPWRC